MEGLTYALTMNEYALTMNDPAVSISDVQEIERLVNFGLQAWFALVFRRGLLRHVTLSLNVSTFFVFSKGFLMLLCL